MVNMFVYKQPPDRKQQFSGTSTYFDGLRLQVAKGTSIIYSGEEKPLHHDK
jgi:hypothetical protein